MVSVFYTCVYKHEYFPPVFGIIYINQLGFYLQSHETGVTFVLSSSTARLPWLAALLEFKTKTIICLEDEVVDEV